MMPRNSQSPSSDRFGVQAAFAPALAVLSLLSSACGDRYSGDTPPYGAAANPGSANGGSATAMAGANNAGSAGMGDTAGSSPGATGGGAGAGEPDPVGGACVPADFAMGANRVVAAAPRISLGKRVVGSAGVTNPGVLVDGAYHSGASTGFGVPTAAAPASVSIELVAAGAADGPSRVLVVWKDAGWEQYTSAAGGAPGEYHFESSADSTDGVDGTWTAVGATITGNSVNNRAHALEFANQRWLRLVVTAAAGPAVTLDEITVHDASESPSGLIDDTWVFFGDSITQLAFRRDIAAASFFDAKVGETEPTRFPALINAGVGGDLVTNGLARLDQALELNADFKYFAIGFGTNDSWGNNLPAGANYENNMRTLINRVIAGGRVPVLARIPFANGTNMATGADEHTTVPDFNQVVDALQAEFGLPCGPDLYAVFEEAQDGLGPDGVHPNTQGYVRMNAAWAGRAEALYTAAP